MSTENEQGLGAFRIVAAQISRRDNTLLTVGEA